MPATNTARNPEPRAPSRTVDEQRQRRQSAAGTTLARQPDVAARRTERHSRRPRRWPARPSSAGRIRRIRAAPRQPRARAEDADHQRDTDGIVRAGLALEQRAGTPGDLAAAQHREDDGGIGRCQRSAEQQCRTPAETEQQSVPRAPSPQRSRRCRQRRATPLRPCWAQPASNRCACRRRTRSRSARSSRCAGRS